MKKAVASILALSILLTGCGKPQELAIATALGHAIVAADDFFRLRTVSDTTIYATTATKTSA